MNELIPIDHRGVDPGLQGLFVHQSNRTVAQGRVSDTLYLSILGFSFVSLLTRVPQLLAKEQRASIPAGYAVQDTPLKYGLHKVSIIGIEPGYHIQTDGLESGERR